MRGKYRNSERRLKVLIAIMTMALVGVIAIQAYWLSKAFKVQEQQFDQRVSLALSDLAGRLDRLESMHFLSQNVQVNPFFSESMQTGDSQLADSLKADSLASSFLKVSLRIGQDTLLVFNTEPGHEGLQTFTGEDSLFSENKDPDRLLRKGMILDHVLQQMVLFEMQRKSDLLGWLKQRNLDSLLQSELKAQNLELPFDYAIYKQDSLLFKSEYWRSHHKEYRQKLFPNDIFASESLVLIFPSRSEYIFQSIWFLLLLSILFTLAVVYTFYEVLKFSLQQKRLGEIKTDFINNMTHEFKTPIATISLAIDAMGNPKVLGNQDKLRQYRDMIKQENQRMNLQVESVLRMALLENRDLELNKRPTDMQVLISECIDHFKLQIEKRGGQVQKFFNDEKRHLSVDQNHLSNAIINILDNAIKYSSGAPSIQVRTESSDHHFMLQIVDKGMGMSKEEQKHIFDRFYRVSTGDLHNIKGHGLGLSYSKGIVESHGGRITVESEKNKGSKFTIYLPINTTQ